METSPPDDPARREFINKALDGARAYTEPATDTIVRAVNLETDELLVETDGEYAVVGITEYLASDQVTIVPDKYGALASYAKFDWKGRYRIIPLGSNVGDPLPLRAGGGA